MQAKEEFRYLFTSNHFKLIFICCRSIEGSQETGCVVSSLRTFSRSDIFIRNLHIKGLMKRHQERQCGSEPHAEASEHLSDSRTRRDRVAPGPLLRAPSQVSFKEQFLPLNSNLPLSAFLLPRFCVLYSRSEMQSPTHSPSLWEVLSH